jgi:hypothetical protein
MNALMTASPVAELTTGRRRIHATKSTPHLPNLEDDSSSATHEIPRILWHSQIPPSFPIPGHMDPVHTLLSYLLRTMCAWVSPAVSFRLVIRPDPSVLFSSLQCVPLAYTCKTKCGW